MDKVTEIYLMLARKPEGSLYIKSQEEAGETSKKPVGPCILNPRGGYPRDIEGHRGSSRVLVIAQEKAMWVA